MSSSKFKDSHIIVRDGVLLELDFVEESKKKKDKPGSNGDAALDSTFEDDEFVDEDYGNFVQSALDSNNTKWVPKHVLLFANGNLVIYPHKRNGFFSRAFSSRKHKTEKKSKVITLEDAGFKALKYDKAHRMYTLHLFPHRNLSKEIVLGFTIEKHAKNWFSDMLGVACALKPKSKTGSVELLPNDQVAPSKKQIFRARDAWAQAFYELDIHLDDVPKRFWTQEYAPEYLRGDVLKAFRIWRDFVNFSLACCNEAKISSRASSMHTITLPEHGENKDQLFIHFEDTTVELLPSIQDTRVHDAMQLFYDATNVLLILKRDQEKNSLQPASSICMGNGVRGLVCLQQPILFDSDITEKTEKDILQMDQSSPFLKRFVQPKYPVTEALYFNEAGQCSVIVIPVDKEEQKIVLSAILGIAEPKKKRYDQFKIYHTSSSVSSSTESTSDVLRTMSRTQSIRKWGIEIPGKLVLVHKANSLFSFLQQKSEFLRPEYASCRLQMFREYTLRLANATRISKKLSRRLSLNQSKSFSRNVSLNEPSFGINQQIEIAENTIISDVSLYCTYVAAAKTTTCQNLILFPHQIVNLFHDQGVEFNQVTLDLYLDLLSSDRFKAPLHTILGPDKDFFRFEGNLLVATILYDCNSTLMNEDLPNHILQKKKAKYLLDIIHAWTRRSGFVLSTSVILELLDGKHNDRPMTLGIVEEELVDKDFQGHNPSYLEHGGEYMFVQRFAKGISRFTIKDQTSDIFKEFPLESRDPLLTAATVLNRLTFSLEHNIENNTSDKLDGTINDNSNIPTPQNGDENAEKQSLEGKKRYCDMIGLVFPIGSVTNNTSDIWWSATADNSKTNPQPIKTWLKISFTRALNYINDGNAAESSLSFQNITQSLNAAEDLLQQGQYSFGIICHLFRATLSNDFHDIVYALRILIAYGVSSTKKLMQIYFNWLLVFQGGLGKKDLEVVYGLFRLLGFSKYKTNTRKTFMKRFLLNNPRSNIIQQLLLQEGTMYIQENVQQILLETDRKQNTINKLKMVITSDIQIQTMLRKQLKRSTTGETPKLLKAVSSSSVNDNVNHPRMSSRTSSIDSIANDEIELPENLKTNNYTKVYVRGCISGLSSEEEHELLSNDGSTEGGDEDREGEEEKGQLEVLSKLNNMFELPSSVFPQYLDIKQVSCGDRHSVIVTQGGVCFSFGYGGGGRLGHGDEETRVNPTVIEHFLKNKIYVTQVSCGRDHTAVVGEENEIQGVCFLWGWGEAGRLGQGKECGVTSLPLRVENYDENFCSSGPTTNATTDHREDLISFDAITIHRVVCGREHTLMLSTEGVVYSCGAGSCGRLGHGKEMKDKLTPTRIRGNLEFDKIVDIAAGDAHCLALSNEGVVFSWGFGDSGALGHGDLTNRCDPKRIAMLQDSRKIIQVACGAYHSVALDDKGRVWTWGDSVNGQLGIEMGENGHRVEENCIPRMVRFRLAALNSKVLHVECGKDTTVVVDDLGKLYTWGHPEFLKNGPKTPISIDLGELPLECWVSQFSIGSYHSIICVSTFDIKGGNINPFKDDQLHVLPHLSSVKTLTPIDDDDDHVDLFMDDARREEDDDDGQSSEDEEKLNAQYIRSLPRIDLSRYSDYHSPNPHSRVLFCGTLLDDTTASGVMSNRERSRYDELKLLVSFGLLEDKYIFGSEEELPPIFAPKPQTIIALSGFGIASAQGSKNGWMFNTDGGMLFRWNSENLDLSTVKELDTLDLKTKMISGNEKGTWYAGILERTSRFDPETLSTNMIIWNGNNDEIRLSKLEQGHDDFNPSLLWPSHDDMKLTGIAVGNHQIIGVDKDGVVYEIGGSGDNLKIKNDTEDSTQTTKQLDEKSRRLSSAGSLDFGLNATPATWEEKHKQDITLRIAKIYKKYCPEKLKKTPKFLGTMLSLYAGKEEDLLNLLVQKYGPEPSRNEGKGPMGFEREHPHIVQFPNVGVKVVQISCGNNHSLALTENGELYSWNGQDTVSAALGLGINAKIVPKTPQKINVIGSGESKRPVIFASISSGPTHCLAVTLGGQLYSWGDGSRGQLGHGDRKSIYRPKPVDRLRFQNVSILRIACGSSHSIALATNGSAYGFGETTNGALGIATDIEFLTIPTLIRLNDETTGKPLVVVNVFAGALSSVFVCRSPNMNKEK